jgi:hypothetical protein
MYPDRVVAYLCSGAIPFARATGDVTQQYPYSDPHRSEITLNGATDTYIWRWDPKDKEEKLLIIDN